jgi:two-component system heavy metal sensor histidine kinase CusS
LKTEPDLRAATARPSIASRLTLLYMISALGILAISSVVLYAILDWELDRENRQLVSTLLAVLTEDAQEPDFHFLLPGMDSPKQPYQLRVFDESMRVLFASSGMVDVPFPDRTADKNLIVELNLPSGRFMTSANWTERAEDVPFRLVQVAVDITDDAVLLSHYRLAAFGVLVTGLAACALISVVVVRRGLRPLREVTLATGRISASQLHERLGATTWPAELMELVTSFNSMLSRLDRAFQSLSRSSSSMAHELRTPINNLIGEADVALSFDRSASEYRAVLESAMEEYQRLAKIVDTLLFFARADNPQHKLRLETFDGAQSIRKVVDFFDSVAADAGVTVTSTGAEPVTANATLFMQAIGNVLNNALQHTPAGGSITVELGHDEGGAARVAIRDTGVGIGPDDLPNVTEHFYRTAASRATRRSGMGLGLSIVKSVMDWHSGRIEITSELGKGTQVVLTFPAAQSP